jgi:peptide/nickel transport system permease protein
VSDGPAGLAGPMVGVSRDRAGRRSSPARAVLRLLLTRILLSVPLLLVVSAIVFILTSLTPGNVTYAILGPGLPAAQYAQLKAALGLSKPLYDQYWIWLSHAVTGNFGNSLVSGIPVKELVFQHLPVTLSLVVGTLVVSVIVGVGLGTLSAVRGGWSGRVVDVVAMTGWVVPVYWLGAMAIIVFAVKLRWLPATGYVPLGQSLLGWLRSLVLPVATLSVSGMAGFAKYTRDAMLDALGSDYVRMARANGVPERSVVLHHAFKGALLQVITLTGLLTVALLAGTVFVENVFALPGLGEQIVEAVTQGNIPVVQGIAVFFTLIVVVVNVLVDLAYSVVSPKVRAP